MLCQHPNLDQNKIRVRYAGVGTSSCEIGVQLYLLTNDFEDFYAIQEGIFLKIDEIVVAAGLQRTRRLPGLNT